MVRLLLSTDFDCKSLSRCSNHVTTHQYIKSLVSLYEYEVHHLYTPTQKFIIIIINIRPGHLIMESFTWPLDHGIVYCTCTVLATSETTPTSEVQSRPSISIQSSIDITTPTGR